MGKGDESTVSDEFTRIRLLREVFARKNEQVLVGIGDDAAVLVRTDRQEVLSVDVAVEDVHFRRRFASLGAIGGRAFRCAISDLAAMGADPRCALSSLVLPAGEPDAAVLELAKGIAQAAHDCGTSVVGGNLSTGRELSITTTVVGSVAGRPLTRCGARPGDGVYVTGAIGGAALGLSLLERGADETRAAPFVRAFLEPRPRLLEGARLRDVATAAIDVSDGLLQDLSHLCGASTVGADIDSTRIPLLPDFVEVATAEGLDPLETAMTGGDDYELLFTAPLARVAAELATLIGHVTDQPGTIRVDGRERKRADGFRHF